MNKPQIGNAEKKLITNTVFLYIMQISGYVFPLISFPYLTRVLGPDKYGIVVFSNAIISYFQIFIDFGFLISATKDCSLNRDSHEKLFEIIFCVILGKLFLFCIGFVCLLFLCYFFPPFFDKKGYLILAYISVGFSIFLPDFFFRGIEKMSILTYRIVVSKFVYLIVIFLLIKKDADYVFIPVAMILSNVFAVALTWHALARYKIKFKFVSVKKVFLFLMDSSVFFLSRIAATLYTTANTVVLGAKIPSFELANWGAANTLNVSIRSLFNPISDSIYPYILKKKNLKLIKTILFILMPLICIGCVLSFFFAKPLVLFICGKEYYDAFPVFRAMLPLILFTLPSYLFGYPVLGAIGKIYIGNISVIVGALFHVIGLFFLFFFNCIEIFSVVSLTIVTEVVVLTIRIISVMVSISPKKM